MSKEVLDIISYLTKHERHEEVEVLLERIKCKLTPLKYTNNSCYQDCILMALFSRPIKFIRKELLTKRIKDENVQQVQNELISIYKTITNKSIQVKVKNCTTLRHALRNCYGGTGEKFYTNKTQDASEFLQYLFNLFKVKLSPIILVTPEISNKSNKITLNYERSRKFIIFYVPRLVSLRKRNYYEIDIPEKIRHLTLYSIVVHRDNHYTLFLKCNDRKGLPNWYYYNDLESEMTYIGSFTDVLNCNELPSVQREGLLYFYN